MALLKEDGSLDVERINKLPFNQYMEEMGTLTAKQINEYLTKIPINESKTPMKPIVVETIQNYGVDADDFLNKMKEKYGIIK